MHSAGQHYCPSTANEEVTEAGIIKPFWMIPYYWTVSIDITPHIHHRVVLLLLNHGEGVEHSNYLLPHSLNITLFKLWDVKPHVTKFVIPFISNNK